MPIMTGSELASYLGQVETDGITLRADLANDLVTELLYPSGLPGSIPTRVRAITFEVGARAVRNVDGYSSESIDDYTYRKSADTRDAGVYLTDGERADLLNSIATVQQGSAFTVQVWSPLDLP